MSDKEYKEYLNREARKTFLLYGLTKRNEKNGKVSGTIFKEKTGFMGMGTEKYYAYLNDSKTGNYILGELNSDGELTGTEKEVNLNTLMEMDIQSTEGGKKRKSRKLKKKSKRKSRKARKSHKKRR